MEFDWDDDKFKSNFEKHGVSFEKAARIFNGAIVTRLDDRQIYGENRYITVGKVGDVFYVLVHTFREGAVRIISARLGGRRDRQYYYTHLT